MAETPARYRTGVTYYHGGVPGLTDILPRSVTGATALIEFSDARLFFYPPYRVTLTTERRVAEAYAARAASRTLRPYGTVYQVRPGADLDLDMDEPEAWACDSAQVLAVVCPVAASRLAELSDWQARWHEEHPRHDRLMSDDDREAYTRRVIRRAVSHGHDEQRVAAMLAAARSAGRDRVPGAPRPAAPGVREIRGFPLPWGAGPRFYHGGPPGLAEVLPRQATGRPPIVKYGDHRQFLRPDYLAYVTTVLPVAESYAAGCAVRDGIPDGDVYEVRPRGALDVDIDEASAWACDSAQVLGTVKTVPASRLPELKAWYEEWHQRYRSYRRLPARADRAAYVRRMVRRAVANGWKEADVLTMLRNAGIILDA